MDERPLPRLEDRRPERRLRVGHLARDEPAPHEIVDFRRLPVERRRGRKRVHVRRANGLVRSLRVGLRLVEIRGCRIELRPVRGDDVAFRRSPRVLGDVHRIGSHVGYETFFVKRLRYLHRLPRGNPERARRGLLQRGCRERREGMARPRLGLHRNGFERRAGKIEKEAVRRLAVRDLRLLAVDFREARRENGLVAGALLRLRAEEEVCDGRERVYLALALDEKPERDRLDAARAESAVVRALDVLPEEGRDLVSDETVEYPPRLLRVHARHVYVAGLRHRLEDGVLRDFIVGDAAERLAAGGAREDLLEVPRYRLPFAVGIARKIYLVDALHGVLEFAYDLLLVVGYFVLGLELPAAFARRRDLDGSIRPRKVADVAHRAFHGEIAPEILAYRLRLRGRFHNQQFLPHWQTLLVPRSRPVSRLSP